MAEKEVKSRVRQTTTALYTQFPTNGRIPFKQIFQATRAATVTLILGIGFVLAVVFSADGQSTSGNKWYEYAPTFLALGAVVVRGSVAALLGVALYQSLWQNLSAQAKSDGDPSVDVGREEGGISLRNIESLHSASRLEFGMLAHPLFRSGWIIGLLGLAVTSAVQPVLQSAVGVRQATEITPTGVPIYHPQFNGSLAQSDSAAMYASGPTTITKRSAVAALLGEKSGLRYTDANVTGIANFGPVKFLDLTCNIEAVLGNRSNLVGWDLYNFTYRYPDATPYPKDPRYDLTQFRDVSNYSVLSDGVDILQTLKSRIEVKAVLFNNTHYLKHLCTVQTATGNCTTNITAGSGSMSDLVCTRDQFINVDSDLAKQLSYFGPAGGVMALFGAFLKTFVGKAALDIHGALNPGQSLFMLGTVVTDTESKLVMPSDLLSHMQRVLWVMPLLAKFGTPEQEALNVTMSILDDRSVILYQIDKVRVIVTVAVLLIIGLACLVYLSLFTGGECGRLTRDSLVHSLTVAGLNAPAIKGACSASLNEILDKAGNEKVRFGVLIEATDSASGHLGFAGQSLAPGSWETIPATTVETPVPGRWYGGLSGLRKRIC